MLGSCSGRHRLSALPFWVYNRFDPWDMPVTKRDELNNPGEGGFEKSAERSAFRSQLIKAPSKNLLKKKRKLFRKGRRLEAAL